LHLRWRSRQTLIMAKAKKAQAKAPKLSLPPILPEKRQLVERAIMLLGSRAKGLELSASTRKELQSIVGAYPSPTTAADWKRNLKSVRDDEIFGDVVGDRAQARGDHDAPDCSSTASAAELESRTAAEA
jgi:hypothetical protein